MFLTKSSSGLSDTIGLLLFCTDSACERRDLNFEAEIPVCLRFWIIKEIEGRTVAISSF